MFEYTKSQLNQKHRCALEELLEYAGGGVALARMIDVPLSTVTSWVARGRISKKGAIDVGSHPVLGKEFTITALRPEMGCNQ